MRIRFLIGLVIVCLLATLSPSAFADGDEYPVPSWPNMLRTLVRFNALDLNDQALMDEYVAITDCDIFQAFHNDDFKWHEVKSKVLESVALNVATFPQRYLFNLEIKLDRYDFAAKVFKLTQDTEIKNVNTFVLYSVTGDSCPGLTATYVPRSFRAVLQNAFYIDGIPLSEVDARKLLKTMAADGNTDRIVFAQFGLTVVFIDPLRKITSIGLRNQRVTEYRQPNSPHADEVRFDARLDRVDFFSDPDHTHLIYRIQP